MKIRSLILVAMFLLGFFPMLLLLIFETPSIVDQLKTVVHDDAIHYMQNELLKVNQQIDDVKESARVLSLLPDITDLQSDNRDQRLSDAQAVSRMLNIINHWFHHKKHVSGIRLFDLDGRQQFKMQRDVNGMLMHISDIGHEQFPYYQSKEVMKLKRDEVIIQESLFDSDNEIRMDVGLLCLISLVYKNDRHTGYLVIDINALDFIKTLQADFWITKSGQYIKHPMAELKAGVDNNKRVETKNAFDDFTTLREYMDKGQPVIIESKEYESVAWIPLFEDMALQSSYWVGGIVDQSGIKSWLNSFLFNAGTIAILVAIVLLLVSHFAAVKVDQFKQQLMQGLLNILHDQKNVRFLWNSPNELKELATELNSLSVRYARICQDRIDANNLLKNEKERAHIIFNSIRDGVITTNHKGKIEYINHVAETIIACNKNKAVEKYISECINVKYKPDENKEAENITDYCLREGKIVNAIEKVTLPGKENKEILINYVVSPVRGQMGEYIGAVLVFHLIEDEMADDAVMI